MWSATTHSQARRRGKRKSGQKKVAKDDKEKKESKMGSFIIARYSVQYSTVVFLLFFTLRWNSWFLLWVFVNPYLTPSPRQQQILVRSTHARPSSSLPFRFAHFCPVLERLRACRTVETLIVSCAWPNCRPRWWRGTSDVRIILCHKQTLACRFGANY